MRKHYISNIALLISLVVFCIPAFAQSSVYFGGMIGSASYDYADVDNSTPVEFFAGFRPPYSPLGVEIALVDLGDADVAGTPFSFNASGINLSGVYSVTTAFPGMYYLLKIGFYSFDTDLSFYSTKIDTTSGSGLSMGAGIDFPVSPLVSLRAELQGYFGVKDFSDNGNVFAGTVGIDFNF